MKLLDTCHGPNSLSDMYFKSNGRGEELQSSKRFLSSSSNLTQVGRRRIGIFVRALPLLSTISGIITSSPTRKHPI